MTTYYNKHVFICTNQKSPGNQCCANTDSESFFTYLKTQIKARQLHGPGQIRVSKSGCLGRCSLGPCIVIYPAGIWYTYASFSDIDDIIQHSLIHNDIVERLRIKEHL